MSDDSLLKSIHAALIIAELEQLKEQINQLEYYYDEAENHEDKTDIQHSIENRKQRYVAIVDKIYGLGFHFDVNEGKWIK